MVVAVGNRWRNCCYHYRLYYLFNSRFYEYSALCVVVKELSFAIIEQAFGRFEKQWRYKKGEMSLETLIFTYQRESFAGISLNLRSN